MVGKFLKIPYSILFEFQVLGFICNTYCIVLFVLGFEDAKKVYVVNVVDATLANHEVFT
jgi:hypothetical protein